MKSELKKILRQEAEEKLNLGGRSRAVKVIVDAKILSNFNTNEVHYIANWKYVRQRGEFVYVEETAEECLLNLQTRRKKVAIDERSKINVPKVPEIKVAEGERTQKRDFYYDRQKAVQYAEIWWNKFNPKFPKLNEDCTNYVSQCLHAGGFPIIKANSRAKGWWCNKDNWSFSWTVAHALNLYLSASHNTNIIKNAIELNYGDVIFYDFNGDGRFDHSTIVTGKDEDGHPLVNAHTMNSRQRYWSYEDSSAYTPNIKYKFIKMV